MRQLYHNRYRTHLLRVDEARAHQISNVHDILFARQATSGAMLNGVRPLYVFAKDIKREDLEYQRGFFEGSRSGQIARDLISHTFGVYEQRASFIVPAFHYLWPTKPILCQYQNVWIPFQGTPALVVNQVAPMIVETLGFDPTAVAFSNYRSSILLQERNTLYLLVHRSSKVDLNFDYQAAEGEEPGAKVFATAPPSKFRILWSSRLTHFEIDALDMDTHIYLDRLLLCYGDKMYKGDSHIASFSTNSNKRTKVALSATVLIRTVR